MNLSRYTKVQIVSPWEDECYEVNGDLSPEAFKAFRYANTSQLLRSNRSSLLVNGEPVVSASMHPWIPLPSNRGAAVGICCWIAVNLVLAACICIVLTFMLGFMTIAIFPLFVMILWNDNQVRLRKYYSKVFDDHVKSANAKHREATYEDSRRVDWALNTQATIRTRVFDPKITHAQFVEVFKEMYVCNVAGKTLAPAVARRYIKNGFIDTSRADFREAFGEVYDYLKQAHERKRQDIFKASSEYSLRQTYGDTYAEQCIEMILDDPYIAGAYDLSQQIASNATPTYEHRDAEARLLQEHKANVAARVWAILDQIDVYTRQDQAATHAGVVAVSRTLSFE